MKGGITTPSDTLNDIEKFYATGEDLGTDIDEQLAKIVANLLTLRLPDDELKEKLASYVRPGNCPSLTTVKVYPAIWGELSALSKS